MNSQISKIWEEYYQMLKRYIQGRIEQHQDSEDILQDIFVKVQNNLCELKDEDKLKSWLFSITNNTITDYYRKKAKTNIYLDIDENIQSPWEEDKYANRDISICLNNMIELLPDIYKQVITMVWFENMTQIEVSRRLGISYSGVKSRVQRAKKLLKEMLGDCCSLEFDHRGNIIDYQYTINSGKYCTKPICKNAASFLK